MSRKRKQYNPAFKAEGAPAAIRNEEIVAEGASKFEVRRNFYIEIKSLTDE